MVKDINKKLGERGGEYDQGHCLKGRKLGEREREREREKEHGLRQCLKDKKVRERRECGPEDLRGRLP